jgi:hypothetical protein
MDMDFNDDLVGGYSLNYPRILEQKDLMAVTKLLVHRMMENPYIVVGDYIQEISDSDLQSLVDAIEQKEFHDVILMSEMLATGEGCDQAKDFNEFQSRADQFVSLLLVESLHRKGLVLAHHENFSFHEDMQNKIVVEKRDGLDYSQFMGE